MAAPRDLDESVPARLRRGFRRDSGVRAAVALTCAAGAYFALRKIVEGSPDRASRNAARLVRFEQTVGLDVERAIQQFVLARPLLVDAFNRIYVWLHWPFLIVALVLVFKRDRRAYQKLSGALIVSGMVGIVIFATFPVSPPRFSPEFVGTVSQAERQHFLRYPAEWSNRLASMPSFHVGWTLISAIVLSTTMPSRLSKVVALLPGPLVAVAVVATGNHYLIDVIVGCALAVGALALVSWRPAPRPSHDHPHALPVALRHHADLRR